MNHDTQTILEGEDLTPTSPKCERMPSSCSRILRIGERLRAYIESERERNNQISLYGASTKGNTLLQVFGLDRSLIRSAAERNPRKMGQIYGRYLDSHYLGGGSSRPC
jgi:C-methyltransferase C-terminal domain